MAGPIDRVVAGLNGAPVSIYRVRALPAGGGIPERPGFYAWWMVPGSIPDVPSHPHPGDCDLDLLYVGIAPKFAASRQTIRSRVIANHLGGNTGSSTLRLSLAALLIETEHFEPVMTTTKAVLTRSDNRRLSAWQRSNLSLTWCEYPEPRDIEDDVIAAMQPPLNLAANDSHPFHETMQRMRSLFRERARAADTP